MTANSKKINVAVVQASPVLFNRNATIEKTCDLINQAAEQGARLVLFPEAFVPAYPRGLSFGTVVGSRTPGGPKDLASLLGKHSGSTRPDNREIG